MPDDARGRPHGRPHTARAVEPAEGPTPLPARAVTAFAARYGMAVGEIAACLGLEPAQLTSYDRIGGPGWLRFALAGIAIERGETRAALVWLLGPPPSGSRKAPEAPAADAPEERSA